MNELLTELEHRATWLAMELSRGTWSGYDSARIEAETELRVIRRIYDKLVELSGNN